VLSVSFVAALLLSINRGVLHELKRPAAWFIGSSMGLASVLYFYGVMTSDVIRVIFLFYLLPMWTTIAARLIYGERIGAPQILVIGVAMAGLWLLLGGDKRIPMPSNAGDWCGLAAGVCWGTSLALLRGKTWASPPINCLCTFLSGAIIALLAYLLFTADTPANLATLKHPLVIVVAVLFGSLVVMPSMLGQIWGAGILPAPTSALLTMTEIVVATISAFILIGTELSGASAFGALVILSAVLADIYLKRKIISEA